MENEILFSHHPQLDAQLQDLVNAVLDRVSAKYAALSTDPKRPVRHYVSGALVHMIQSGEVRIAGVDKVQFINSVVGILAAHLDRCRIASQHQFTSFNEAMSPTVVQAIDPLDQDLEVYFRRVADTWSHVLLPSSYMNEPIVASFCSDILTQGLMMTATVVTEPSFVLETIASLQVRKSNSGHVFHAARLMVSALSLVVHGIFSGTKDVVLLAPYLSVATLLFPSSLTLSLAIFYVGLFDIWIVQKIVTYVLSEKVLQPDMFNALAGVLLGALERRGGKTKSRPTLDEAESRAVAALVARFPAALEWLTGRSARDCARYMLLVVQSKDMNMRLFVRYVELVTRTLC